ncbi:MAG: hypothetical protein HQK86_03660 [Nitrospinae bacterium]|nr:hypothetical protein [Nitrospinota bacterium]MBF0634950.1 hypothetical protein [Nitrospinota bacterium]
MEAMKPGALATALEIGREKFNARFASAKALYPALDGEYFANHLRDTVAPAVEVLSRIRPERVNAVADELYGVSLELMSKEMLGPATRYPEIAEAWETLFPKIAQLLSDNPRLIASGVSNAVYNVAQDAGGRYRAWIDAMGRSAPHLGDWDVFLKAGVILAWRLGMAHYRESAISALETMPDNLAFGLLAVDSEMTRSGLMKALRDPWWNPSEPEKKRGLSMSRRVGGFRGFGGPFITPPEVIAVDGRLYAFDAESCWVLFADCYGSSFKRYGGDLPEGKPENRKDFQIDKAGVALKDEATASFPPLADWASYASTQWTLAVSLPQSHYIYLVAAV